jgi:hypothetical protein
MLFLSRQTLLQVLFSSIAQEMPLFITWWGERAPLDETDLTSNRDDSSKAVEKASRRGGQTLAIEGPLALRVF